MTFLYLIVFMALSMAILALIHRNGLLHFPVYFYAYLALFHVLLPIFLMEGNSAFAPVIRNQYLLSLLTETYLLFALLLVMSAALAFPLGWLLGGWVSSALLRNSRQLPRDIPEGRRAVHVSWFILLCGMIGFFTFFHAFGGILPALEIAREFRTDRIEIENSLSFMRPIGDFVKVAGILFAALYVGRFRGFLVILGLVLAVTLAFAMLLFQGGRLSLAVYVSLLLIVFNGRGNLSLIQAVASATAASLVLFFGYEILSFFYELFGSEGFRAPGGTDDITPLRFFVVELSFPAIGLATALDAISAGLVSLRYGSDVILGLVSIVPSRFLSLDIPHIGEIHTAISNPQGKGTMPVDMMSYGIYSVSSAGPAMLAILVGFTNRLIFHFLDNIIWPNIRFALRLLVLFSLARSLIYFNPVASINSLYFLLISSLIVYVAARWSASPHYSKGNIGQRHKPAARATAGGTQQHVAGLKLSRPPH